MIKDMQIYLFFISRYFFSLMLIYKRQIIINKKVEVCHMSWIRIELWHFLQCTPSKGRSEILAQIPTSQFFSSKMSPAWPLFLSITLIHIAYFTQIYSIYCCQNYFMFWETHLKYSTFNCPFCPSKSVP